MKTNGQWFHISAEEDWLNTSRIFKALSEHCIKLNACTTLNIAHWYFSDE